MYRLTREYKQKTNKERNEYVTLIKNVLSEHRIDDNTVYYEKHHIFPKSLYSEWKFKKNNIILLTRDEHLLAHKLLKTIFPVKEMSYAYSFMLGIMHLGLTNSEISKELWNDLIYRENVTNKNKIIWSNEAKLKEHSKILKIRLKEIYEKDPEKRYNAARTTRQPVKNIETGIIFNTMAEAGKWANLKAYCKIGEVCRHIRGSAGKTPDGRKATWEYVGLSERSLHKKEYYEKCMNQEYKPKNRKTTYKKKKENGWRGFKAKMVHCITTDEYFTTVTLAEKYYNITGISGACRGNFKYAGKHPITKEKLIWEYKEKPEDKTVII